MTVTPVFGAPEGWDAFLLARRRGEFAGPILHATRDDARMARLAEALSFAAPEAEVLRFPAWDCLPYDRVSPNAALVSERIATLARLLEKPRGPRIVLTTVNALVQRVPPRSAFTNASLELRTNGTVQPEQLARFLEANGYGRAGTVMEPGEYAMRGGIIDVFPAGESDPVRLDLFGDTIESIRMFDPGTQRSADKRQRLILRPVSEVPLDPDAISRFRSGWRETFGQPAADDPIYLSISDGRRHPGMEHWVPLFHERMETLLDYLPGASVSLDHQADEVLASRFEMIEDHYAARRLVPRDGEVPYRPLPPDRLYLDHAGWDAMLADSPLFAFSPFAKPDGAVGIDGGGRPGPVFFHGVGPGTNAFDQLRGQVERWNGEGKRIVVAAWTRGSRERLANLLREHDFRDPAQQDHWAGIRRRPVGSVSLVTLGVERGFVADQLALVGEQDLLGERISRPPRRRKSADQFIAEATEIAEGDLVVHQEYGIGRYDGLETLTVTGAPHDCLRLIYDGDEKLFLPVENIEVLSRFGSEGQGVALDKLGGVAWQSRKARMKQRIRDMAGQLIRIAAARKIRDAAIMAPGEGAWDEFCARFPFAETEDQSRAIADVLEDLAVGRPMDRLICGDVGFGKTEVALRAAFVAAMSGAQVAVVVPTTLLARQHYRTFSERFSGLPVKVAQLSRMVTAKEAAEVRRGITDGSINIVIGTHALLAKSVEFADLGLLVVDEEQHFGVAHKERLKQLKADVHVLTLTATPIPRTLQLALTGVREMSLIATPPVDRLAVRTFIMPFDGVVIREALQRERFRGGQVFCVVPRIEDLSRMAERLAEIVPEARMAQAHGRLAPTELERVMAEFGDGHYDILLSTNIVESGLDMPAVNTLVIHRADMFGLGQLYQLRGRVGRGKQRGYAYLTWPPNLRLSVAAEKRLTVMQTLDALGAGFTLASHDLDIRGAGNLLGDEQSGHIREVGIELYQQMLEDAVSELRAGEGRRGGQERDWTPNISLGLPVLIPEDYVRDLPVRLGLYRRIGGLASDAETEAMAAELVDRFGPLPQEVENLLQVVALKRACREAGVEKLEAGPKGMVLSFRGNAFSNPAGLVSWLASKGGLVRLRPDHKLAISREMDVATRLRFARDAWAIWSGFQARRRRHSGRSALYETSRSGPSRNKRIIWRTERDRLLSSPRKRGPRSELGPRFRGDDNRGSSVTVNRRSCFVSGHDGASESDTKSEPGLVSGRVGTGVGGRVLLALLTLYAIAIITPDIYRIGRPLGSFGLNSNGDGLIHDVQGPFVAETQSPAWQAGIRPGDRLDLAAMRCVPVNADLCASMLALWGGLNYVLPDRKATLLLVASGDRPARQVTLVAQPRPRGLVLDFVLLLDQIAGIMFVLGAAWLVWIRPGRMTWGFFAYAIQFNPGQAFLYYAWLQQWPAALLTQDLAECLLQAVGYAGLLLFALRVPDDRADGGWRRVEQVLPVLAALLLVVALASMGSAFGYRTEAMMRDWLFVGFVVDAAALGILLGRRRGLAPRDYQRIRWVIWGCLIGLPAFLIAELSQMTSLPSSLGGGPISEDVCGLLFLINGILCLFVVEAVRRPTIVSVSIPLRRATMLGLVLSMPALFLHQQLETIDELVHLPGWAWLLVASTLAFLISRLHEFATDWADRLFDRDFRRAELHFAAIHRRLEHADSLDEIERLLVEEPLRWIHLASAAVFRERDGAFWRHANAGWRAADADRLDGTDGLLAGRFGGTPYSLDPATSADVHLPDGLARPLLGVPIGNPRHCFAVALYGSHEAGTDLSRNERGLLVGLARDAAVAYAHVHNEKLRGRIADLESELSRVSAAAVSAPG